MTVGELLDRMDSVELSEWMAYDLIEPLPDTWLQTGIATSMMCNLWSKTRSKPEDFIPRARRCRRQSVEDQLTIFQGIAARQEIRRQGGKSKELNHRHAWMVENRCNHRYEPVREGPQGRPHRLDSFKSTVLGIGAAMGIGFGVKGIVDWVHSAIDAVRRPPSWPRGSA